MKQQNKVESNNDELLRVKDVARALRVDDTTVRRWIKCGALEAITLPHASKRQSYRVRRDILDNILNGQAIPNGSAGPY